MPKPKEVTINATMNKLLSGKKVQVIWFNISPDDEVEVAVLDGTNMSVGAKLTVNYKDGDAGKRIDPATGRVKTSSEIISTVAYKGKMLKIEFLE